MTQKTEMKQRKPQKEFCAGAFLSGLAAFAYFDLAPILAMRLGRKRSVFAQHRAAHHLPAAAAYVGIYILVVALSLPEPSGLP